MIQKVGNQAVHSPRPIREYDALQVVKELHHICYWLVRTYTPDASREGAGWRDDRIPRPLHPGEVVPRKDLEALEKRLAEQNEEALKRQQERDALDAELQTLREWFEEVRTEAEQQPDTHDYSEADTRTYLIDVELHRAGWPLDQPRDCEYEVTGMPNKKGIGYADYVLWGDDGKPLAVVEAKKTTVDSEVGQQQAKAVATGEPHLVGPVGKPSRRYEFHWRFAALSMRVGEGRIRLPLQSALHLANALQGASNPQLVGAIAA